MIYESFKILFVCGVIYPTFWYLLIWFQNNCSSVFQSWCTLVAPLTSSSPGIVRSFPVLISSIASSKDKNLIRPNTGTSNIGRTSQGKVRQRKNSISRHIHGIISQLKSLTPCSRKFSNIICPRKGPAQPLRNSMPQMNIGSTKKIFDGLVIRAAHSRWRVDSALEFFCHQASPEITWF